MKTEVHTSKRAWLVYLSAAFAYIVAVLQRSSFGVVGMAAQQRFQAGAAVLSLFVVLQLLVYAGMQIPAGLLADRYGSRVVIAIGAAIMALGQLDLAFAQSVPSAIVARILVGGGDALTFTCVMKLLPSWFAARRIPMLVQITTIFGQLGQLGSTIGLAWILDVRGWTATFVVASAFGGLAFLSAALGVHNQPGHATHHDLSADEKDESFLARALSVAKEPGTRLGFWMHGTSGFQGVVFAMMWGYPFLLDGEGLSAADASALFTVFVVGGLIMAPVVGWLVPRHPLRLSNLTLTAVIANTVALTAVLLWPGPAPIWLLVVWMLAMSAGGPGSTIGFEVARTVNLHSRIGTATGLVIMGAFTLGVLAMGVVGVVLDATSTGGWDLRSFRIAFATELIFVAVGVTGIYRERRLTRAKMAADGVVVPPWRVAIAREWRRIKISVGR